MHAHERVRTERLAGYYERIFKYAQEDCLILGFKKRVPGAAWHSLLRLPGPKTYHFRSSLLPSPSSYLKFTLLSFTRDHCPGEGPTPY